jgi:pimeloyl-ACP methyl ester carboxylesterase
MTPADDVTVSRAVSRDGTEIGYFTTGDGPPLVLVHGTLGDHTRWRALRPYLEPHFTVHAMDRRGRGASGDHPAYDPTRELEDIAAVVDAITTAAGSPVAVVGSSGGASYALGAARLTDFIRRLVLFEPPAGPVLQIVPPSLHERLDAMLAADDREGILVTGYRAIVGLTEAQIDDLRAQPEWPNRLAAAHTVPRELATPPERLFDPEQAAQVTVPVLVVIGSETPEPFKVSAEMVAAALPDARVTILEGQGHAAEMLAPQVVAEAMLDFLHQDA